MKNIIKISIVVLILMFCFKGQVMASCDPVVDAEIRVEANAMGVEESRRLLKEAQKIYKENPTQENKNEFDFAYTRYKHYINKLADAVQNKRRLMRDKNVY